jgi:hypothetical protein
MRKADRWATKVLTWPLNSPCFWEVTLVYPTVEFQIFKAGEAVFLFSNLWCSLIDNHTLEDLAKFGYNQDMKVELKSVLLYY